MCMYISISISFVGTKIMEHKSLYNFHYISHNNGIILITQLPKIIFYSHLIPVNNFVNNKSLALDTGMGKIKTMNGVATTFQTTYFNYYLHSYSNYGGKKGALKLKKIQELLAHTSTWKNLIIIKTHSIALVTKTHGTQCVNYCYCKVAEFSLPYLQNY